MKDVDQLSGCRRWMVSRTESREVRPSLPFSRLIALSLRPSAASSSSSCKVKVTSDVLCYNRWDSVRQVQCLDESGRDNWSRASQRLCRIACDIRPVKSSWTGCWICLNYHVRLTCLRSLYQLSLYTGKFDMLRGYISEKIPVKIFYLFNVYYNIFTLLQ